MRPNLIQPLSLKCTPKFCTFLIGIDLEKKTKLVNLFSLLSSFTGHTGHTENVLRGPTPASTSTLTPTNHRVDVRAPTDVSLQLVICPLTIHQHSCELPAYLTSDLPVEGAVGRVRGSENKASLRREEDLAIIDKICGPGQITLN